MVTPSFSGRPDDRDTVPRQEIRNWEQILSRKWLLSAGLAVSLLGVTACGDADGEESGDSSPTEEVTETQEAGEEAGAPQPDLDGIPEVVAEVNGDEILKDEFVPVYEGQFQQLAMQSQASGQDLDQDELKMQTAESMVGTELLIQEADGRGFTASEEKVNQTLDELASANGLGSADDFLAAMEEQGMGSDEVTSQLELQVKVDQLIAAEATDTQASDQEVQDLYDQVAAEQEEAGDEAAPLPPLDDVRPQLEEQVEAQKESQAVQALVEGLRADADVVIHL